ncbi:MAG: hypothetical protein WCJ99_16520 [Betaproteobacteria bacterium]|jgi:hypothetical protein
MGEVDIYCKDQGGMMTIKNNELIAELSKLGDQDPDLARLMGVIMALAGEVFVLKAQVQRLSMALRDQGIANDQVLEKVTLGQSWADWLSNEETQFSNALLKPYLQPDVAINSTHWMRQT